MYCIGNISELAINYGFSRKFGFATKFGLAEY